jgi:hypothetical protein
MVSLVRQKKTRTFGLITLAVMFFTICAYIPYFQPAANTASPTPPQCCCLPATTTQWESSSFIYQEFPARGPSETAWAIAWSQHGHKGLWIEGAWFWRKPPFTIGSPSLVRVLGQAGLSDIFVPYHGGTFRPYDMYWGDLHGAIPQDTGDCGTISGPLIPPVNSTNPPRRVLIKEIRDRGVAWTSDRATRRGEELLLWGTFDTGNYEYIIQYGFRDDGTVTFRLGSTGYNNPNPGFLSQPHMHNALWYVDINLDTNVFATGSVHNSVMLMRHVEPSGSLTATDSMTPFNNGVEGGVDWNDKEFTCLNISNTLVKNAQGNNISYDLMPMRSGTARHVEDFTRHDFWVTHTNSVEQDYIYGFEGWNSYAYINPPEPIMDTDVTLWYMSSNHHLPRDEDFEYAQGIQVPGVALTMWSGFDLHPRNLFDDTPLHGCAPAPSNLVGWWPLDDVSGGTTVAAINASGGANPSLSGTPYPAPLGMGGPTPISGVVGGALSFDGVNDYVEIPDNAALNFGSGDFSIDAWIRTTQTSGINVILDKREQQPKGYSLYCYNGSLGLQLAIGGNYANYGSNAYVADGNWHHIAVTVDRTSNIIGWFLDGQPKASNANPLAGSLTNTSPLRLGVRSFVLSGYWNGELDELELFNRALQPGEVWSIFAAGRLGKCR